jgi:hypothetical protein
MKIRTQFIFTLFFFAILLIGMVASLIATDRQVNWLREQEEIARRVEQGADELNYLWLIGIKWGWGHTRPGCVVGSDRSW